MSNVPEAIRFLGFSVDLGARQLATTEAIIDAVGRGTAPPTLRLYSWSEPVVIIGVGQPISDVDLDLCTERGYTVLRRVGGGTAVYHDRDEVSIDLILPAGHPLAFTDVHRGYDVFSSVLIDALACIGVSADAVGVDEARDAPPDPLLRPLCFGSISPFELRGNGKKLAGLCQIRRRGTVTYQAAIYRRFDPAPLLDALRHQDSATRAMREERLTRTVTDLESLATRPVDFETFALAIQSTLLTRGHDARAGEISIAEVADRDRLVDEKYANPAWTKRR